MCFCYLTAEKRREKYLHLLFISVQFLKNIDRTFIVCRSEADLMFHQEIFCELVITEQISAKKLKSSKCEDLSMEFG